LNLNPALAATLGGVQRDVGMVLFLTNDLMAPAHQLVNGDLFGTCAPASCQGAE